LRINLVDALVPLQIQERELLDHLILLGGWHALEFVHMLLFVP
jgi:hypothetical protein